MSLKLSILNTSHDRTSFKNVIGSVAVVVDPIDNKAISFYQNYGFIMLPSSGKMFLPMNMISKIFPDI